MGICFNNTDIRQLYTSYFVINIKYADKGIGAFLDDECAVLNEYNNNRTHSETSRS